MKKFIILLSCIFILFEFSFGNKSIVLKELMKPSAIYVGNERLFISEGTSIYIYSLKNYSLINKFGKKGEGPGEFRNTIGLIVPTNTGLIINSVGRLSYYTTGGELIKSFRTGIIPPQFNYFPVKDKFVGISMNFKQLNSYFCVSIFDKEFNRQKQLLKIQQTKNGKIFFFAPQIAINSYFVYENKIYILSKNNSAIDILNYKGDKLKSFKHGFKKTKFNKKEKQIFLKLLNKSIKSMKKLSFNLKDNIMLPEYYPIITKLKVSNKIIYILGRKRNKENGKLQSIIRVFNLEGKKILENDINLNFLDNTERVLITFDNFIFYKLKENENEEWILYIKHLK